ncbi:UDP-N-acetylmuramoyl-tripeptide--D-alanyl-D-alanine ligase [Roseateles koreensis]|uniref:UDP-N-acetylmuramoyl-tripeptide--D-alanyl-D-alanine ligase n=1 Tax=Roseateles koreensis TaxID=2987526 RepID=A0ABT5KMK2_9BURK|nr:UDP-N-acetylmuramoyl-tripeptide--D-alanyl-D-alanine ligase [Roseateles koreensis]MDC8784139.1 UDP-N-acetylmuramoyl-tripeptide--D-alanyl-D-alanine ligase [Roseateles koreensis]
MTLGQAHQLLLAQVPQAVLLGDPNLPLQRVHSDSRSLRAGDLFVALRGERFDAHDFLPQIAAQFPDSSVAVLAERGLLGAGLPGIQVPDAKRALGLLAQAWRAGKQLPVIAVTGSNGKTTVTQMIASILRAWHGESSLATEGNYNNDIGVPLTVLRLRQDEAVWHQAAVIELGMNHPGEIAPLAAIARPTVALVNNAQREHQEFMQTVEAAARENGAALAALGDTGVAVFPADDACAPIWAELAGERAHLSFALQGQADVTGSARWMPQQGHWALALRTPAGTAPIELSVAGLHNVRNALAAATCALAAGAPLIAIVRGLQTFRAVKGRSQLQSLTLKGQHVNLIDDSYNANPDSVRAAIDVLAALPGASWLVLGDMGEVGDEGPAFHAEVGAYAAQRGLQSFWTVGTAAADAGRAFGPGARSFAAMPELLAALAQKTDGLSAQNILVKGSRFMRTEQVVAALQKMSEQEKQEEGGSHAA